MIIKRNFWLFCELNILHQYIIIISSSEGNEESEEMKMARALARKGNIYLVKYENRLYGVEKITKGCPAGLKYSENKEEVVKFFVEYIKSVRRSKNDFNLEIYGN